jgi:hypothetical protein
VIWFVETEIRMKRDEKGDEYGSRERREPNTGESSTPTKRDGDSIGVDVQTFNPVEGVLVEIH